MARGALVLVVLAALAADARRARRRAATHADGCPQGEAPKPRSQSRTAAQDTPRSPQDVDGDCGRVAARSRSAAVKISPRTTAFVRLLRPAGGSSTARSSTRRPGFVIQGGDPSRRQAAPATPSSTRRSRTTSTGSARRDGEDATEAPGTSGSQFFVVTGDTAFLTPDYAVLGRRQRPARGAEDRQARRRERSGGKPTRVVVVKHMAISSS